MAEITHKRLKELERAESQLLALEAGGVDNWDNYDDALAEYRKENEVQERREALLEDLMCALAEGAHEPSERGAGYAFDADSEREAMKILETYKVIFGE